MIQQISRKIEQYLTSIIFYFLPFFLFASQTGLLAYISVWPEIWLWHFSYFLLDCCLSWGMEKKCCCLLSQIFCRHDFLYWKLPGGHIWIPGSQPAGRHKGNVFLHRKEKDTCLKWSGKSVQQSVCKKHLVGNEWKPPENIRSLWNLQSKRAQIC